MDPLYISPFGLEKEETEVNLKLCVYETTNRHYIFMANSEKDKPKISEFIRLRGILYLFLQGEYPKHFHFRQINFQETYFINLNNESTISAEINTIKRVEEVYKKCAA